MIWCQLMIFGSIRCNFIQFCAFPNHLLPFGACWCNLMPFDTIRAICGRIVLLAIPCKSGPFGAKCCRMVQDYNKWCQIGTNGAKWCKIVLQGAEIDKRTKWNQMVTNDLKLWHIVLNGSPSLSILLVPRPYTSWEVNPHSKFTE